MRRPGLKSACWLAILTVTVLLFYWKIVFTKQFSILWQWEMVSQYYSWDTFAAVWLRKGIVPLWDPFRYGGNSFIGEMQSGLFYPFKLALYLSPLDQNGLLSERAFHLFYVFSHWLAALWMFFLARYLKLAHLPALVAGICFGLGGFVQWTAWNNILDAMPWLPLVVLFILRAFDSTRTAVRLTNACAAGLALGMTFLAGSLHIAIMDGIVVATLTAYLWFSRRGKLSSLSAAAIMAAAFIVSLLFGAVQLLPSFEYSPLAYRWVGGDSPIRPLQRIPYPILAETTFGPQSLFAFVLGEANAGKSDMTPYLGVLPLILVIIGAWKYWGHWLVRYLAALGILAWVYTWGPTSILHGVLYLLPYLDVAREADRFIYVTHFAMALLAGFGVQFLFIDRSPTEGLGLSRLLSVLKWSVIGFAALLAAASLHFPVPVTDKTYLSLFFLVAAYGLLLFLERPRALLGPQCVLVFLIAWDLYAFSWIIQSKRDMQKQNGDSLAHLVYDSKLADFIKSQPGMPRVHFDMDNAHNIGDAYGVPVTWAMSATLLMDYAAGVGEDRQRDLLGVRYTIRPKTGKVTGPPVYSDQVWNVYENHDAMPRAWIVHRVEVDRSTDRPLKQVLDRSFDLWRTAVIDRPLQTPIGSDVSESADTVKWRTYEPNRLELEIDSETAGLLVLGEVYYPGWTASVDGAPATIYRADGLVRAVAVGKGMHRVSLQYRPASVRWGAVLSILTFLGVCGAGIKIGAWLPVAARYETSGSSS